MASGPKVPRPRIVAPDATLTRVRGPIGDAFRSVGRPRAAARSSTLVDEGVPQGPMMTGRVMQAAPPRVRTDRELFDRYMDLPAGITNTAADEAKLFRAYMVNDIRDGTAAEHRTLNDLITRRTRGAQETARLAEKPLTTFFKTIIPGLGPLLSYDSRVQGNDVAKYQARIEMLDRQQIRDNGRWADARQPAGYYDRVQLIRPLWMGYGRNTPVYDPASPAPSDTYGREEQNALLRTLLLK